MKDNKVVFVAGSVEEASVTRFLLAYDNFKSVRFFGSELVDWWARDGKAFNAMLAEAVAEASALEAKCRTFDAKFRRYHKLEMPYGVPLDCRKTYTKVDWLIWCGSMTGKRDDMEFMCGGVHRFLNETPDRIPFSDWYLSDSRLHRGFIARSVVGGVFMPTLAEKWRRASLKGF